MANIQANGISIEVERHGAEGAVPLLLVRGLGSQIIHWPDRLIDRFVANGFHVITYDNRDAGLSQKFDEWGLPDIEDVRRRAADGLAPGLAYSMNDMAADGIGVLDALGISAAHVLGISMGGMIVQLMAHHAPERFRSATIVMSSSGNRDLPGRSPEMERLLLSQPDDPNDRGQFIEHTLRCDKVWGSPGFPFEDHAQRTLIGRAYDRCHCPAGLARQYAAVIANGPRTNLLKAIQMPVLVVHGTRDPLTPIEHGRDIAANIASADLIEIEGMGHDLEGSISDIVVAGTTRLARGAGCRGPAF